MVLYHPLLHSHLSAWFVACNKYYQNDGFEHSHRRMESAAPTILCVFSSSAPDHLHIIIISSIRQCRWWWWLLASHPQIELEEGTWLDVYSVVCWRGSARVLSNDNYTCVELMAKHMCLPTDDDDDEDTTIRGNSSRRRGGSKVVRRLFGVIHNCELMRWSRLNETPNRIGNFYCLCVALASAYTLFYSHLCSGRRVLFVIVSVAFNWIRIC